MVLGELLAGLEQTILKQLTIGITEALGVEDPNDDISKRILQLSDSGKEVLDKYCLPRIRKSCMRDINNCLLDEVQTVREANSKYAEDSTTFTGSFGNEEHFFQGLDEFNGCPGGSNIEVQMKGEFQDTSAFTTSNYGGIKTDLKTEWEFVVALHPETTYPGEHGLAKADGTRHPGRVRNSLEHYMKLDIMLRAGLLCVEVIALRLCTCTCTPGPRTCGSIRCCVRADARRPSKWPATSAQQSRRSTPRSRSSRA